MFSKRSGKSLALAASLPTFIALTALCLVAIVSPSSAQQTDGTGGFLLSGDASLVQPGNGSPTAAQARSTGPDAFGSVGFAIPAGLKVSQLTNLSTDYKFVVGSCWNGSPRFTANITNGTSSNSILFYIGPPPSYTGCPSGDPYTNSGNLATPASLVDVGPRGGPFQHFSDVKAVFGNYTVTGVHLDVDGGTAGNQTVDFDNTQVNERLVTYEPPPPVGLVPPPVGLVPLHGEQLLAEPVGGTTPEVKLPGQTAFNVLTDLSVIPVGSTIDTRGSRVQLTAATGAFLSEAPDHPVDFYGGLFKITQKPGLNARATMKLTQKLACGKKKKKGAKKAEASAGGPQAVVSRKRRRRRHVWGSGSGNYSTSGGGGTGSVRGTTWLTKDTCKGTKFKVTEGLGITVFDFKKKKKINLGPGDKYFAAK
jgi:hypothetical protein